MKSLLEVTKLMDIFTTVNSLKTFYQNGVSSPLCGDELTTQKERKEKAYY